MKTPGTFDEFKITPGSKVNGVQTKYAVEFKAKVPVDNGDMFYLSFPDTITAPKKDIPCEVGDCLTDMECTSDSKGLVITFKTLKDECKLKDNAIVKFSVGGITNAGSMVPSEPITAYWTTSAD